MTPTEIALVVSVACFALWGFMAGSLLRATRQDARVLETRVVSIERVVVGLATQREMQLVISQVGEVRGEMRSQREALARLERQVDLLVRKAIEAEA